MDCVCIFDVPLTTVTAPAASIIFSLGLVEGEGGEGRGGLRHAVLGCRKCVKFYQMMNLTQCRQTEPATSNISVKSKFLRSSGREQRLRASVENRTYGI